MFKKIGAYIAQHAVAIASAATCAAIGSLISGLAVSKYKDRAYKELMKQHDKETAERLSNEFNHKFDELKKEYNDKIIETKEEFNLKVSNLCKRYGIDPEMVVR